MSQCVSCANQPSDNDSLGGAAHEGTVTPMVIGIIIGTVFVFVLVVCALFYCVKLENHKYMAKIGDVVGGDRSSDDDPPLPGPSSSSPSPSPSPCPPSPLPLPAASLVGSCPVAPGRRDGGDRGGQRGMDRDVGREEEDDVNSGKSRPSSSITVVPSPVGMGPNAGERVEEVVTVGREAGGECGNGMSKKRLFGWGRKNGELFGIFFLSPPSFAFPLPPLFLFDFLLSFSYPISFFPLHFSHDTSANLLIDPPFTALPADNSPVTAIEMV